MPPLTIRYVPPSQEHHVTLGEAGDQRADGDRAGEIDDEKRAGEAVELCIAVRAGESPSPEDGGRCREIRGEAPRRLGRDVDLKQRQCHPFRHIGGRPEQVTEMGEARRGVDRAENQ